MTRTKLLGAATTLTALALASAPAMAKTKFEFWYGLSGDLSERVQEICGPLNESQPDYEIVCVSQENYDNTLQNTIAACRANKQPTVTQIFDAGTLDLMLSKAFVPVRQLVGTPDRTTVLFEDFIHGHAEIALEEDLLREPA